MNAPCATDVGPRLSRRFRLQWEDAQQAWVLLYPEGMVRLNRSAGEILLRCDGSRTLDAIVAELEQRFGASGLAADVAGFIDMARGQQWVEAAQARP
ncbi:pyrroloquinoline quinone biosynthesis peptide chaperone PqqD [Thauera linaloolentis]|uniref:PqqA binding protein n=1 Tax=Thauera linaloolentis (strain DSM 12138 / JCM 21573 / CCUG 41526 / CIP 105981 / IAM 15112 / NBRC 102519 / 47Lol) TaxID=1123367 RepID=N6Y0A0_THAL4|nr:pyrroloquinoline quinone biosynthesis peptide chaperone PqqD [Thauera linaloolentis]ENO87576.1 PqqD protein [Thauera linaloolentis 47Lol = DSM 12138]MCM8564160.1 pyrroloquinoline quinone biosynthesis peptide chaperone PqqD [Thauera linaloolentis]